MTRLLVVAPDLGLQPGPSYRPGGLQTMGRLIVRALAAMPEVGELTVWTLNDGPEVTAEVLSPLIERHRHPGLAVTVRGFAGRRLRMALGLAGSGRGHDHVMFLHVGVARLARLLLGRRFSLWLVGIDVWRPLRGGQRHAVLRASPLFSISRFTASEMQRANPGAPEAQPVHLALEPDDARSDGAPAGDDRPPSAREPIVLVVGRLTVADRRKGYELVLAAWSEVARAVPAARLWVVGDGDDRERLESVARASHAGASIEFHGRLGRVELIDAYHRARVFALPSTKEGFGLVHVEAMRSGLPCVCSRDAAAEIVVDGKTGFVVEPSAPAVAAALTRLLDDGALADRLGNAGRRRLEERFTFQAFRERLGAVLLREGVLG